MTRLISTYRKGGYQARRGGVHKTPYGKRIPDVEVKVRGKWYHVEIKTGRARYGGLQRKKDQWLERHRGIKTIVRRY